MDLFVYVQMMVIKRKEKKSAYGLEKLLELMNLSKREGVYQVQALLFWKIEIFLVYEKNAFMGINALK